jgi:hypothetical protein
MLTYVRTSGLAAIAAVVTMNASAPAHAAEVLDCTLTTPDGLLVGSAKYQIDGAALIDMQPPDIILSLKGVKQDLFRYQILKDDDAGIVAANPRSIVGHSPKDGSPVTVMIGAVIIVINRSNGKLQIGSVMQDGAHEIQDGYCKLNSATP